MRTIWKALLVAVGIELASFMFLLIGNWEFMGEIDTPGKIGVCLHLPGFSLAKLLHLRGNMSWLAIIGAPLLIWLLLAYSGYLAGGKLRTKPS